MTGFGRADINNAGNIAFEFITAEFSGIAVDDAIVYRHGDMIDGRQPQHLRLLGINDAGQLLYRAFGDNGTEIILNDEVQDGDFIGDTEIRLAFVSQPNSSGNFVTTVVLGNALDDARAITTRDEMIWSPGDVIDGKQTSRLLLNPSINDFGDVVFAVEFTDGTDGLIISSVPEPNLAPMLIVILILPRYHYRRRHNRAFSTRRT